MLVGSSQGGVNIEEVAAENPSAIIKEPVDIINGITIDQARYVAKEMGFSDGSIENVSWFSLTFCCSFTLSRDMSAKWLRCLRLEQKV